MNRIKLLRHILLVVAVLLAATALPTSEAWAQSNIRINGTAVGIGPRLATRSFTLIINSYTPDNQVTQLNNALRNDGQDGLLQAMTHLNAGRIQIGGGVGVRANAIMAEPWGDRGTRITVFYERNISIYERRYGTRSEDYKIGYAEIFLDNRGRGEGTLIPAAKVRLRGNNTWEVEDFGTFPARLMGLYSSGRIAR